MTTINIYGNEATSKLDDLVAPKKSTSRFRRSIYPKMGVKNKKPPDTVVFE